MDPKNLLKSFTIGFIPLLVFIIADELFGTETGLAVAVATGIIEVGYHFFRYRRIEKFVLFDTGLIIILGLISLILHDEIYFKLKPALIEAILLVLLGIHAFSEKPVLLMMGQRYLKDVRINKPQEDQIRRMSVLLFFVVLVHTGLVVYAAYFMSHEAWAFISGGLFYIIFGLLFVIQLVYNRFFKKRTPAFTARPGEEWFDLVDQEGRITGRAPRSAVHGNPDLLHPVVHLHVFHKNGQLYLQKRSKSKDVQPGKWDTAVGGHVHAGEEVPAALKREAEEELGIKRDTFQPLYRYVMRNDYESELVYTFRIIHNGPFRINRDEIDFGRFWSLNEITRNLGRGIFTPNFEQEFKMLRQLAAGKPDKKTGRS
jgi:isopentenyldiphosphate isomerase/intracellular septation protein A